MVAMHRYGEDLMMTLAVLFLAGCGSRCQQGPHTKRCQTPMRSTASRGPTQSSAGAHPYKRSTASLYLPYIALKSQQPPPLYESRRCCAGWRRRARPMGSRRGSQPPCKVTAPVAMRPRSMQCQSSQALHNGRLQWRVAPAVFWLRAMELQRPILGRHRTPAGSGRGLASQRGLMSLGF